MPEHEPRRQALDLLAAADPAARPCVVGLDGFVDTIVRPVASKTPDGAITFLPTIEAFAKRIAQAAGKSTAIEMITQRTKLGGNGPIMAHALACLGLEVTCIGALADRSGTRLHDIFAPLAEQATVLPVVPAASTEAIEFTDGKIMLQHMECLDLLDFAAIIRAVGAERLQAIFEAADFMALDHWSSLPRMDAIWDCLQAEVCPRLSPRRRRIFFDLGDPQKHPAPRLAAAARRLAGFTPWYEVALGLNLKESEHLAEALGCEPADGAGRDRVAARAAALRAELAIERVAIHPVEYAVCATVADTVAVDGPYEPNPKISTGAGDHFNAGFCCGWLLGGSPAASLQMGVATSGYYVRHAESPSLSQLHAYIQTL